MANWVNCLGGFVSRYVAGADVGDPLVSPVFGDFTGLPPLLNEEGTETGEPR